MTTPIWVNIGSGNGLLPDDIKEHVLSIIFSDPLLASYQWGSLALTWEQFHTEYPSYYSVQCVGHYTFENAATPTRGHWVKLAGTFVWFSFIPESPRWLYTKGRYKEGDAVMAKFAKWNGYPKLQDKIETTEVSQLSQLRHGWVWAWSDLGSVSIWRPSFKGIGISMFKIRWSRDRLIFNMGSICWLVRRHLYIETSPFTETSLQANYRITCFG